MVRNLVPLLEILACLYCIAGTYGKKVRCNIYVVVFVIAEMLLLIGINDHGIPTYLISLSYVLIFIYCLVDYNASVIQAIINLVISVVLLGIFQLVGYFVLITIFRKHDLTNNNWEVAIMAFSLVISYFLVPKMHLNSLSEFLRKNKFIAQVVLGFVIIVYASRMWKIKVTSNLSGQDFIFTIYFVILVILLVIEWQKSKQDVEKGKRQLEKSEQYYGAYEKLIKSVREKKHDYKNHINTIRGMIYTSSDYTELKKQEEKYMGDILEENSGVSLATMVENLIIAGFLSVKLKEAEQERITVKYQCILDKRHLKIPEYEIVEMLGILIDNAYEAERLLEITDRIVSIHLFIWDNALHFEIINTYAEWNTPDLSHIFDENYSTKGEGRGIGLYKLWKKCKEFGGYICVMEDILDDKNAVKFKMILPI